LSNVISKEVLQKNISTADIAKKHLRRTPSCSSNNILSLVERRKLIEAIILLRNLNCKYMRLKCNGHEYNGSGAGVGADDSACSQFQSDAGHRVTCSMILSCSE
jgi:hypothetical protein